MEGEETQTTIGILRGTLNINLESGGVSCRFIHVFVRGGQSFAVCQRFQIKGKESGKGAKEMWQKTKERGHRNLIKSLKMSLFDTFVFHPSEAVKATLVR